jgi:hypothetical protein
VRVRTDTRVSPIPPSSGHGGFTEEQDILPFETTVKCLESIGPRAVHP